MFSSFIVDRNPFRSNNWFILNSFWSNDRSKFWRIILVRMSGLCEALEGFKFFNSFWISSTETWLKVNTLLVFYLSLIILILGWSSYFSITFKTGSAIFSALIVGSSYGGSFRLVITVSPFSVRIIFSLFTPLSVKKASTVFLKFLVSATCLWLRLL